MDRISAGLFHGDERGERASTAAVRLAFCHHDASRRWLATQESLLLASRIRLGETPLASLEKQTHDDDDDLDSSSDDLFGHPPPVEDGHVWVPFERAAPLLRRRDVTVTRGWASVPNNQMPEVLVAAHTRRLARELERTKRRADHVFTESPGSVRGIGSPGLARMLRELVRWRPSDGDYAAGLDGDGAGEMIATEDASRAGAGDRARGRIGPADGVDGHGTAGGDGIPDADGTNRGYGRWRRGWRRGKKKSGAGSSSAGHHASSLPAGLDIQPNRDGPYGRIPTGPWIAEIGVDAKRVLRVLKRGVKGVAARPYPPCMRRHLQTLHSERHLKHHSRWQFTLFLKGMDLTVDEALAVWRSQFVHGKMADFQREHTYAVRHSFGLEGKMADYPPHTCERLAKNATRGDGEPGCPFAGCGGQGGGGAAGHGGLGSRLSELRKEIGVLVDPIAVEDIANFAERGAPRAACKALFASIHGTSLETMRDDGILADLRFPHDWYAASAELEEEARTEGGRGGEPVGGGGSALGASDEAAAGDTRRRRRRVELELESSSDEDEDEDGDARDMGELREVLTR